MNHTILLRVHDEAYHTGHVMRAVEPYYSIASIVEPYHYVAIVFEPQHSVASVVEP
jgi:hypothetical protein